MYDQPISVDVRENVSLVLYEAVEPEVCELCDTEVPEGEEWYRAESDREAAWCCHDCAREVAE